MLYTPAAILRIAPGYRCLSAPSRRRSAPLRIRHR